MAKLNLKNPQVISYLEDSKEELVARLLRVQAQLKIERAQSEWLDLLADEEYRKVRKYQDQKLEEYFVKD